MTDSLPRAFTPERRYSLLKAFTPDRRAQLIEDVMASATGEKKIYSVHYGVADSAYLEGYEDGAAAELEACCELLDELPYDGPMLHAARRPKPPSLKEQALTALSHLLSASAQTLDTTEAEFYIRRALEALPND